MTPSLAVAGDDPLRLFILRKNRKPTAPCKLPPLQSYSIRYKTSQAKPPT